MAKYCDHFPLSPTPCPLKSKHAPKSNLDCKYGVSLRHHFSFADHVNPAEQLKYGKIGTYPLYITTVFLISANKLADIFDVFSRQAQTYFWNISGLSIT